MTRFNHKKYRPYPAFKKNNRRWPDKSINKAPNWCSVDLRDGNQALVEPMNPDQKLSMFKLLIELGFKEIEVGFPAASQTDYDFVRAIIDQNLIPQDVTIQVLTQAREELIARSFESLKGAHRAIVHLYNSTSTVQREQVFGLDKTAIKNIAINGAELVKQYARQYPETDWVYQYSPESFTGTEMDFALDVCNAVAEVWEATIDNPVIINLPATVEMTTPNVYADQIEWINDNISNREAIIISLHTHNDRGCGVAAAELGVMAGADRVEGTLLGNGERTGNMDIVIMAMNLYSQGIDPKLHLADMDKIIKVVNHCTQIPLHPRHPYAGELVFTAFSGSHQDAIKKCLQRYQPSQPWQVAYLPIDPADLGRNYQEVIRINSQSGKGGIAYVMEREYGIQLPRRMQVDFSSYVQKQAELDEGELSAKQIHAVFNDTYINTAEYLSLQGYQLARHDNEDHLFTTLLHNGNAKTISAKGQGVLDAFICGLHDLLNHHVIVIDYAEHTLGQDEQSNAIAYVQINIDGQRFCGAGISNDIVDASLKAVLAAINRSTIASRVTAVVNA
jgi:2-isopropylmalate synthase